MSYYSNTLTPPKDSPESLQFSPDLGRNSVSPPQSYGQVLTIVSPNVQKTDNLGVDMLCYSNILTPPKDSPESLQFFPGLERNSVSPPQSYGQVLTNVSPNVQKTGSQPCLEILEQSVNKFRFRYTSELSGNHGSLNGCNSDRSRKQTFPSVKLLHYHKPAIIRCSLYQIDHKEPHAHRLLKKVGSEERVDPHNIEVGPDHGFTATFINMGIIHTAKKDIVDELLRKYTVLKREEIIQKEGSSRKLNDAEKLEIKKKAEFQRNNINLNQVCLRFDAFSKKGKALLPICSPVYSNTINNLKSAQTGNLKIVRMDRCSSTSRGGCEIFILVEKVTKKNIEVRFFELDDNGNEIWSDYGRFSDLDVHYQYAIVFKTPAYKTYDIDKHVKVYMELQRPSDGARSEPKDFTYTPCEILQNRKRARYMVSNYNSSSSVSSKELPAISSSMDFMVSSTDLDDMLCKNNMNSEEILRLIYQLNEENNNRIEELQFPNDLTLDTSSTRLNKEKLVSSSREEMLICTVESEIRNFFDALPHFSGDVKSRVQLMLKSILNEQKYKLDNGNNVLHLLALKNNYKQNFLINLLNILQTCEMRSAINIRNQFGLTPLHLAVQAEHRKAIELLLNANADISIQDLDGNSPLHFAIMKEAPESTLHLFFQHKNAQHFVNLKNNEGNTALHLAVKTNNLNATKILSTNNANVNLALNTNGYTPLHMAVVDQRKAIVQYLLRNECDASCKDFNGNSAWKLAKVLIDHEEPTTLQIYEILETHMKLNGTFEEVLLREDEQADETSDMEVVVDKSKHYSDEESGIHKKYYRITHLPDKCTLSISTLLNSSERWKELAERLDYGHLIRSGIFKDDANPSKSFLDFITVNCYDLFSIRTELIAMGEIEATNILDDLVRLQADA